MKKKYWPIVLLPIFLIFTFFYLSYTFGLFESTRTNTSSTDIARWSVKVNDDNLSGNTSTFTINRVNWSTSTNVKEGKAAPGSSGYFDIEIDPNGAETSIRYDVTFDFSVLDGTSFSVDRIIEVDNKPIVRSGEFTYSNIISLEDIEDGETDTIRVYILWPNIEANNESDTSIAESENGKFKIPVEVSITQHFDGETITPYSGG